MEGSYVYYSNRLYKARHLEYVTDKRLSSHSYMNYMLLRLLKMFKYENLPDTIPSECLELYLLMNGTAFVTEVKGDLYVFEGTMGGEPDPYYRPTKYIVANPALKLSAEYDIKNDGILVRNDKLWYGLYPMMARYSSMLAENLVTLRLADIMLRVVALLTSPEDSTKKAAEIYLKKLEKGELGVIGENRFFEGLKMQSPPSNNGSYLTQFIELHQYLKASFYNEIGLDANFNMKRESINVGETQLNQDILLPLADLMLETRKEDVEKINQKYGTDIIVDFDSAWKLNQQEIELELSQLTGENNESAGIVTDSDSNADGTEFAGDTGEYTSDDNGTSSNETTEDGENDASESNNDDDGSSGSTDRQDDGDTSNNEDNGDRITVDIDVSISTGEEAEETGEAEEGGDDIENETEDTEDKG